jgi:hypothetical protein
VTITGTGFTGATGVTFDGIAATNVVVVNDTTITATSPAHAVDIVDVVVQSPNGDGTLTNAFTYDPAPPGGIAPVDPPAAPLTPPTQTMAPPTRLAFTGASRSEQLGLFGLAALLLGLVLLAASRRRAVPASPTSSMLLISTLTAPRRWAARSPLARTAIASPTTVRRLARRRGTRAD